VKRDKPEAPCEAVMLLVQRMESHPEEFNLQSGKWSNLLAHFKERVVDGNKNRLIILSDMECTMVWEKFKSAGKRQLHSYVMKTIIGAEEDGK